MPGTVSSTVGRHGCCTTAATGDATAVERAARRGPVARHAAGGRCGVRRGLPRGQRHGARARRRPPRSCRRPLAGVAHARQRSSETVPLLRRTFGAFESAERRQLGVLVAGGQRSVAPVFGPDVDPERLGAALTTVRHLLGLAVSPADGRSVSDTRRRRCAMTGFADGRDADSNVTRGCRRPSGCGGGGSCSAGGDADGTGVPLGRRRRADRRRAGRGVRRLGRPARSRVAAPGAAVASGGARRGWRDGSATSAVLPA